MGARTYWQQHRRTIGTVLLAVPCVNFFAQVGILSSVCVAYYEVLVCDGDISERAMAKMVESVA